MKKIVNIDYIAYISEINGYAEYKEFNIINYSSLISDLSAYIEQEPRTIPQVKSKYKELFPIKFWYQGYCLDNEYDDVEYSVVSDPLKILSTFNLRLQTLKRKIGEDYRELKKELSKKTDFNQDEFNKDLKSELTQAENELREDYISDFIDALEEAKYALNYEMSLIKLKEQDGVVAYSSDQKGWSNFNFLKISDNVGIKVKTNFCYGRSSYFNVTIIYKDIPIVSYSDLVQYYYARAVDIIQCTRSFTRKRESWMPALRFAVDCANKAQKDPQDFIRSYILSGLTILVDELSALISQPEEWISSLISFKDKTSKEINCYHIDTYGFDSMLINDNEFPTAFIGFKVTDSLKYIEGLRMLSNDFPFLDKYIRIIHELNKEIYNRIESTKAAVDLSLPSFEDEVNKLDVEKNSIKEKLEPHYQKIEILCKGYWKKSDIEKVFMQYRYNTPEYANLINKLDDCNNKYVRAKVRLNRRVKFSNKLASFLELINNATSND